MLNLFASQETFAQNLNSYKDKLEIKATIDDMQQFFDCCGNEGYEDWFRIQWYPDDFLDHNSWEVKQHRSKEGSFLIQDVPFSCCDPTMKRPCIHHKVHLSALSPVFPSLFEKQI